MNIDNGKSIENFNDIPEFYKEKVNLLTSSGLYACISVENYCMPCSPILNYKNVFVL
jgi:hypothetical protein